MNTESKKVFYTLEDEQTAQQDLTPEATSVQEVKVEKTPVVEPEPEPTIVKHTLEIEEVEEVKEIKEVKPLTNAQGPDLVPTTSYIRNFNVFYEEVVPEYVEDDFIIIEAKNIINNIEVIDAEVVSPKANEDQFTLSFDMPLNEQVEEEDEKEHTITFNLDDGIGDVNVNEYVEVKPVLEYRNQGETRYNLEEYMELESKLTGARSKAETHEPKLVENELVFEKKTIKMETAQQQEETMDSLDPMNSPINEILRERADERRRKLKNFNYKFQNNRSSIDEIEKQPAYKRQGVDLNDVPREQKVSRTTLSEDSNDDLQLRSNNSFLHDNVD